MVVFVEQVADTRAWYRETAGAADCSAPPGTADAAPALVPIEPVAKARRLALLSQVVTAEILPRLAFASQAAGRNNGAAATVCPTTIVDTGELVRLLLVPDAAPGMLFIDGLLARGITVEALYTGLLPDAARWLGLMWEEDRCDFARVTIAVGRLQQATRRLSPRFHAAAVNLADAHSLLLLPAPGEQHTFGLQILAEFFQRAGWLVAGGPQSRGVDAAEMVRQSWFDVVGFSLGSERMFDGLARNIRQVRRASRNRYLGVMVGGPLFHQRPDLVALAGADASAADAPAAILIARDLVTMRVAAE